jgi:hypothetical protein
MAKVYDYKGEISLPVLLEDPRVTSNAIYFFGMLHDKNSLSPVFNIKINTNSIGNSIAYFSNLNNSIDQTDGVSNIKLDQLFLKKPTVHVNPKQAAAGSAAQTLTPPLDNVMWWTLDRSYEKGDNNQLISDGISTTFLMTYGSFTQGTVITYRFLYGPLSNSQRLDEASGLVVGYASGVSGSRNVHFIGVNSVSKLVFGIGGYIDQNQFYGPYYGWTAIGPTWPTSTNTNYSSTTNIAGGSEVQFIGLSLLDNNPLFIIINRTTYTVATTVQKVVWQSTTPTVTQMYSISSAIPAGGTNAGGNRMGGATAYPASCSQWFTDPRIAGGTTKCWYYPYFDVNRNFHPLLYTWDQTNDTFNRETDITITGDLSSVHANMTGLFVSSTSAQINICSNMICHTFVNESNRYVMYINIDSRNQYPTTPGPRTSVTYLVNSTNPKELTYHSKITWPDTPKNFVFLNDSQTLFGMFFQSMFKMYAWNNSTGWQETVTINKQVTACGRDADGRIWYVQSSDILSSASPELHILTPSLPVTITINSEFSSYDYAGTPINTYLNVSAYNASGNRIVADVKLVINGGSMTFSDSTTVKTITTLIDAEKQQNIIITGAGFSNITASVEL